MAAKQQRKGKPSWDKQPRKVRSDAKIKNLSEEDQLTLWQLMNPPENGGEPYSLEAAAVWLLEELDLEVSTETVSQWHSWYALQRRFERASSRVAQAQQMLLEQEPDASEERLQQLGQMVFTAETIESGDLKGFVSLLRESSRKRVVALDERRIQILEANEKRKQETEAAIKAINSDRKLTAEQQRAAVLEKMDEFFGLKKAKAK